MAGPDNWGGLAYTGTISYTTDGTSYAWPSQWLDGTYATAASSANLTQFVWTTWQTQSSLGGYVPYEMPRETPEQTAAREERNRLAMADASKRAQEHAQAAEKARALLIEHLDVKQREEYLKVGRFHVETKDGTRVYRLEPGRPPTRIKGEDGSRYTYCIHPREIYPQADTVLALKLLLEADEEQFLHTANASRYAGV